MLVYNFVLVWSNLLNVLITEPDVRSIGPMVYYSSFFPLYTKSNSKASLCCCADLYVPSTYNFREFLRQLLLEKHTFFSNKSYFMFQELAWITGARAFEIDTGTQIMKIFENQRNSYYQTEVHSLLP